MTQYFTAIRKVNIIDNRKPTIEFVDFLQTLINNTVIMLFLEK